MWVKQAYSIYSRVYKNYGKYGQGPVEVLGIWSKDETTFIWGKIGENLVEEKVSELGLEGWCVTDC